MEFLDVLRRLVETPGVSGYEDQVRDKIAGMVSDLGDLYIDGLGNLVLELGGEDDPVLLAAHMDEIGLVITHIEENGLLRFRKVGGIDDRILPSMHVTIHTRKGSVPGIIGATPPHIQFEKNDKVTPWHSLFIDVGAEDAEEARELGIDVLDPVTLEKPWSLLGGGRAVASRAIDNRFGCSVLVLLAKRLAENPPSRKVYLAWTVQEEVGLRGAWALAHRLRPRYMFAVDTTTCCNPVLTGPLAPGKGPVVRAFDNAYISSPALARKTIEVARKHDIPIQIASAGGGTDAAAFQRLETEALALGAAVKYTHSTTEYLVIRDAELLVELLENLVNEL